MMKKIQWIATLVAVALMVACSVSPKEIRYGQDNCHYCRMHVVDKQHGAEIVTKKGKVYIYDAMECMLNEMAESDQETFSLYLTNVYLNPGVLLDAHTATYVISEAIPSPMGMNLTAFETREAAEKIVEEHGGEVFDWAGIQPHFNE